MSNRTASQIQVTSSYIPTLDGWRAIAIILVLAMHCRPGLLNTETALGKILAGVFMHAAFGVDIFFALSGFLICTLLLREKSRTGKIYLGKFYVRRFFRIIPPLLAYLAVLLILRQANLLPGILNEQIWSVVAFVRNYFPTAGNWWYTGHFWSLAIEEHFYLAVPVLLALLKWRTALFTMSALAILTAAVRAAEFQLFSGEGPPIEFRTESRIDTLLYGAVLALLLQKEAICNFFHRHLTPKVMMAIFLGGTTCLLLWSSSPGRRTLIALIAPLCIAFTVLRPYSVPSQVLERPALRWIGRLSYSIYIWQMLFLVPDDRPLGWTQSFPQALLFVIVSATLSYFLLEQPMIRLGSSLAKSPVSPRPAVKEFSEV